MKQCGRPRHLFPGTPDCRDREASVAASEGGSEYDPKTKMLIPTALSSDHVDNVRPFVWTTSLAAKAERCDAASHHGTPVAPPGRGAP